MTVTNDQKRGLHRRVFLYLLHVFFVLRRGLTVGVRAIVRSEDGKFLLVRHTYTPGWHFPGGGVERGQSAEHALSLELLQETGLRLSAAPILHGAFHNCGISKRDHVLVYLCEVEGSLAETKRNAEIAEIGFFGLGELPEEIEAGTLRRMRELVECEAHSETW